MTIRAQRQILENKNYYNYLKENSHFIKYLNRDENNFLMFKDYVKDKYALRPTDKISDVMDKIELASSILEVFK